ncbi:hypothetical protein NRA39_10320 [Acinetobacter baumannii]|nr:hypothetical protein [Acinetobacter baumannii]
MSDLGVNSSVEGKEENNENFNRSRNRLRAGLYKLSDQIVEKSKEVEIPLDNISSTNRRVDNVVESINLIGGLLRKLKRENRLVVKEITALLVNSIDQLKTIDNWQGFNRFLLTLNSDLRLHQIVVEREIQSEEFLNYKEENEQTVLNLKIREKELKDYIENVKTIVEQTKNVKIHDYYDLAAKENQDKSDINRVLFIFLIFLSLTVIWFSLVTKGYFGLSGYDYYFFKGSLVLTSITLITYFLKQSVKYQKMADQCKQTKLELEAFPSYVANLSNEDPLVADLRKELAMKYFGRDVDNKSNDETSNILQDQMKNTTEMVKAAMEVLKKSGNS